MATMKAFLAASQPYADPDAAKKLWGDGDGLPPDDRLEFYRKANVFLRFVKHRKPHSELLFREIVEFVNGKLPKPERPPRFHPLPND